MKLILLSGLICVTYALRAQDPTFSQFSAVPLYYNPAFAGSANKPRLIAAARNQWESRYQTYYLSYDQTVDALHGGIGIVLHDDYSGNVLNRFYAGAVYAPKFTLSKKIGISPGINIGYMRTTFDFSHPKSSPGIVYSPIDTTFPPKNNLDISAGFVLNTKSLYVGFAVDHINPMDTKFIPGPRPTKYTGQAGYTFQKNDESDFSASLNLLYQRQSQFHFFQTNLSFRYKWAILGIGSTDTDGYIGIIGYQGKRLIVGYSYEYFVGPVKVLGGTHDLTLRCFLVKKEKKGSGN